MSVCIYVYSKYCLFLILLYIIFEIYNVLRANTVVLNSLLKNPEQSILLCKKTQLQRKMASIFMFSISDG